MLTYELQRDGDEPLYEKLYQLIRDDIISGKLKKNEKLPSKRALAGNMGISTITVENAYELLLMEGYIHSLPRKGYYVSAAGADFMREEPAAEQIVLKRRTAGNAGQEKTEAESIADFTSNQTRPDSFPFSIWARLTREVLSLRRDDLMKNPPTAGMMELRGAIADHLAAFRGIHISPEQVIIGAGTEYLYGLIVQLLGFDKCYAAEDPGYRKVSMVFASYGVKNVTVPLDEYGMSPALLASSGAHAAHITPSHHFPTGITMPITRRRELLDWAQQSHDHYLIEDDYDSEFRMTLRPVPSMLSLDAGQKVIYMNTFTKSLSSTIRISYMVLPPDLLKRFNRQMSFYSCTVPTFEQITLAEFIRRGYFEKHINRMRTASRKKRDLLLHAIKESSLGQRTVIYEKNAGLHFLMNIDLQEDGQTFIEKAGRKGVLLRSLDSYFDQSVRGEKEQQHKGLQSMWTLGDQQLSHTFVMNYSSVSEEGIAQAVQILEQLLCEDAP